MTTVPDSSRCLILFAHGARDPRWAEPLGRIRELIAAQVGNSVQVHQAYLELMSPSLSELTAQLASQSVTDIVIVPIFLGQGMHVRSELPQLLSQLQSNHSQIRFTLTTAIGENEQVLHAIAAACIANL